MTLGGVLKDLQINIGVKEAEQQSGIWICVSLA